MAITIKGNTIFGPNVVTNDLVLSLDAANVKSYPGSGTSWTDLSGNNNTGTLTNGPTFNSYESRTNGVANTTSGWGTLNCTLTPNSALSPDGTTNATTITSTSTINSFAYPGTSSISNTIYTVSIYAKQGTSPFVFVYDQYNIAGAWFNLSTGAVGSVSGSATASIVNAGNGWYRCIFTKDNTGVTAIANRLDIGLSDTDGSYSVTNGRTAYIYGVQREIGSFATSYIPTTSSPVTRTGPATLVFDGTNDYVTMPSSSNLLTFGTGEFSVSFWINLSVVTNQIILTNYNAYNTNYVSYFAIAYYAPSLGLGIFDSSGNIVTGSTATTSTWFHYCFTKTSTTFTTYKNGTQAHTTTSAANNFSGSGRTILIGGGLSDYPYMNGKISSLQIYNRTLSSAEILQNYNALRGRFGL